MSRCTGWLDADAIATCVTEGLIEHFGCAFTRVWLVEADRQSLRLVASSGLYTRLNGSFARVPMGSFKVGKIAQHCIPFLSNALPDEVWVKDRAWAIENNIQGFAGLPLMAEDQSIGVLAVFSHAAMAPEFLEVLQMLSLSVAGALASALNHQAIVQASDRPGDLTHAQPATLSEQLATILGRQKLSLLGVEQRLNPVVTGLLVKIANSLAYLSCHYCRLVYEAETVVLEAILAANRVNPTEIFRPLVMETERLGGTFYTQADEDHTVVEVCVQLPQTMKSQLFSDPAAECSFESSFESGCESGYESGYEQAWEKESESPLSEREQEVITLLAQGLRDREIAEHLFISERTVKFHAKNMIAKLKGKTRIQAIFEATKRGYL